MTIPIIPNARAGGFAAIADAFAGVYTARNRREEKDIDRARENVDFITRQVAAGIYPRDTLSSPSFMNELATARLPQMGRPRPSMEEATSRAQLQYLEQHPEAATAPLRQGVAAARASELTTEALPTELAQRRRIGEQGIATGDYEAETRAPAATVRRANTGAAETQSAIADAAKRVLAENQNVPFLGLSATTVAGYHALGIPIASIFANIRSSEISSNASIRAIDREYERAFQRDVSELMKQTGFGLGRPDAEALVRGDARITFNQTGGLFRYTPPATRNNPNPQSVERVLNRQQANTIRLHQNLQTYKALADMDRNIVRYGDMIDQASEENRRVLIENRDQLIELRRAAGGQSGLFGMGTAGGTAAPRPGEERAGGARPSDVRTARAIQSPQDIVARTIREFGVQPETVARIVAESRATNTLAAGGLKAGKAQMRAWIATSAPQEQKQAYRELVEAYFEFLAGVIEHRQNQQQQVTP